MIDITTSTTTVYSTSSVYINWDITAVRVYPLLGDKTNVVREIDYIVTGTSLKDDNSLVQSSISGTEKITLNLSTTFTDYHNLTKPQLVNWVNANIGHDRIMNIINDIKIKIDALKLPVSSVNLPWSN
ncbi:hypothetical protein UFOVP94_5 [uncultured Caudovirales phage]|uniref:DUF7936 domain-containing protein n=1 Tax=uncultured Caudovirales phage TaxID=2100421 RepID=A0A6J7WFP1_9CAUD|nr:hypothetical protein UFOVP94_5 [uncultured Caudovirales phage]CAB5212638.1 hypothetical protein UFOVP186_38 [uncultured Caudovirales phage]